MDYNVCATGHQARVRPLKRNRGRFDLLGCLKVMVHVLATGTPAVFRDRAPLAQKAVCSYVCRGACNIGGSEIDTFFSMLNVDTKS